MTGTGQITQAISQHNAGLFGADGWEISAHAGARPSHAVYQGRQYPNSDYDTIVAPLINDYNCRHSAYPIILGLSKPMYTAAELRNIDPPDFVFEGKTYTAYEATQEQRKMERAMRRQKDKMISYDAAGLKDDFTTASIRLNRQREAYVNFSKKAGIYTQFERTAVSGYGRSLSGKAVSARKSLTNGADSGIMGKRAVTALEQAKEREKKTLITDTAVNKVGKAEIPGFSDEQNLRLQQLHRDLLRTAKDENGSNEVLKIWNVFTDEVVDTLGSENRVDLSGNPDAVALVRQAYFSEVAYLHNHPSTGGFSYTDIKTFIKTHQIKLMSVVTNQGEVYAYVKSENYSDYEAIKVFNSLVKKHGGAGTLSGEKFSKDFSKLCKQGGIHYVKQK